MSSFESLLIHALPILLAITLHEAAHAYAARYFGDNTAYSQGRMSLNPIKHIDPLGTIAIPLFLYLAGSPFLFGYAKPVPVDFSRLRNPRRDTAFVSLAGPLANFIMALIWLIFSILLIKFNYQQQFLMRMGSAGVIDNLVFFSFNLLPLPPLDGGRILTSFLPPKLAIPFAQIERYGFFILIVLMYLKVLHYWMSPVMGIASQILHFIVYPLKLL